MNNSEFSGERKGEPGPRYGMGFKTKIRVFYGKMKKRRNLETMSVFFERGSRRVLNVCVCVCVCVCVY